MNKSRMLVICRRCFLPPNVSCRIIFRRSKLAQNKAGPGHSPFLLYFDNTGAHLDKEEGKYVCMCVNQSIGSPPSQRFGNWPSQEPVEVQYPSKSVYGNLKDERRVNITWSSWSYFVSNTTPLHRPTSRVAPVQSRVT